VAAKFIIVTIMEIFTRPNVGGGNALSVILKQNQIDRAAKIIYCSRMTNRIRFTQEALNKGFDPEKPLVFLDIDGCLNSVDFAKRQIEAGLGPVLDQVDPRAIGFLNEIFDWNFVISSTWRKFKTLDQLNEIFRSLGFQGRLLDTTPDFNWRGSLRGNEVREWMKKYIVSGDTDRYVILDDDDDYLYWHRNNLILIDPYFGLSPNHIYRAKRIVGDFSN